MLTLPSSMQVFLCTRPVDLRKGFDGLRAVVEAVFARSVFDGHLFLFVNHRRDRLKALWWDQDGLVIFYKRLEQGCFELPRSADERGQITLDATAPGGTRTLVRMAHRQGLLTARPGETVRQTLSSTFGQGRSALVLEVTVEEAP